MVCVYTEREVDVLVSHSLVKKSAALVPILDISTTLKERRSLLTKNL